jgi:hypothetical protein
MSALQSLENQLEDIFVKKAPPLSPGGKKAIIEYLPWINLFLGLVALYTAYALWHWAHVANKLIDYANSLASAYGVQHVAGTRMSFMVWVSLAVLFAQAAIYIVAFPALRERRKSGWDLLFYAMLLNIVYGVVVLFSDYGAGNLVGSLIGSAIGLYFLFQIRSGYVKTPAKSSKA